MLEQSGQTLSERLIQISGQLPAIDPVIWHDLCGAIRDVARIEEQGIQQPLLTAVVPSTGAVVSDDLEVFLAECTERCIDVRIDAKGDFLCETTRSLWDFWRVRGKQLQAGFFAAQGEECLHLRAKVEAHEQRIAQVDMRCRKLVDTLAKAQGA